MAKGKRVQGVAEAQRRIEEARVSSRFNLDLSGLGLSDLPESIRQLRRLQLLNLTHNKLTWVPGCLGELKQLQTLSLSHNQLTSIPERLSELKQLRALELNDNQLASVPDGLGEIKQLQWLSLSRNQLRWVPDRLGELKQLQSLELSGNQLASVPESLGQLESLQTLDLTSNRLTSLPTSFRTLTKLRELFLHGNGELRIPHEVLGPAVLELAHGRSPADPGSILRYYFEMRGGKRPLNEVKLILMGRGGVGKTSIVNRLVRNKFDLASAKTEGIQITQWPLTVAGDPVRVHVWDFGGQEIMHATHQFFLTQRSLYLVVLSGREGSEDEDAEYWLKLAASFGAGSPVIVVLNKMHEHRFDVNRGALRQKYPIIQEFVATDCQTGKDGNGIDTLNTAIHTTLATWKAWHADFPEAWFGIKERLSAMKESYLTYEQFQSICQEQGETDEQAHAALAGYMHDLGIALNYNDDPRLRDTHVLNPHWVTGGIYRILNADVLARRGGELHFADLAGILPADPYPRKMHIFLIDLMRKFELCVPFPSESDHFLVPELLDKQQPEEANSFSATERLSFEYHYPILPEGLLPRFIVRSHFMSEGQARWRSGVILQFEGCRALVKADIQDKRVQVLVEGLDGSRRRLLAVIRSDFDRIHASFADLKPKEWVGARGYPGHLIDYAKLLLLERKGRTFFEEHIGDDLVEFPVSELLGDVDLPRRRHDVTSHGATGSPSKVFCSYSHKDEQLRNEMETHLKVLVQQGLIVTWYDGHIHPGDDWAGAIDTNLELADIVLLMVSSDFIASTYCNKEMTRALEREREGRAGVIPVIVRDAHWKGAGLFADHQVLPDGGKAIDLWRPRDSGWRNVCEGIERVVEAMRVRR